MNHFKKHILVFMALLLLFGAASPFNRANASSYLVVPINWSLFTAGMPADANSIRLGTILNNTNKYALATWYPTVKGFTAQTGTYLDFGGIGEANIRPSASEALSLAVSLKTGLYDPALTGIDLYSATTKAAKLVRSLAYRHVVNISGGWGNEWQTALWAAYAGIAGWLMWDSPYLTSTDQQNIRQMVEYEANRFIGYQVPYYKNTAGTIITAGDSKGEENAWNAMILQAATAMMPNHANFEAWNYKKNELMISAFSRPANVADSATIVNGRSLANWLYGSNINDDGVMINHTRAHPDYMSTIEENSYEALVSALAGKSASAAAFFNSDKSYNGLVDLNWVSGAAYPPGPAVSAPGGTIYVDNSSSIYYPQGNDWGTSRRMQFALNDVQADAFGYDSTASQKGSYWEPYHAQAVLDMQNRSADRRTYIAAGEDTYSGREEWVAVHAAQAYLTKWLAQQTAFSSTTAAIPIVVDNRDREFTTSGGTWTQAIPADKLGMDNRYFAAGTGSAKARFTPRITTAGYYKVYAWWTAFPNHATNAPYVIYHNALSQTVITNQEVNGGQWNLLGSFYFAAGSGGYIELNNNANEYVTADAVKLELDTNKAMGAAISSFSSVESGSWGKAKVNDGMENSVAGASGWSSDADYANNHNTEWLQIDLGSAKSISKVDLYPRNDGVNTGYGFPVDFTIQISSDGLAWSTPVTRTAYALPGNSVQSFVFSAASARYVKIAASSLRSNPNDLNRYRLQFAEVEIY